ncbi:DivIVA domain-containing protein [Herbiconiux flava]|uniref:Cell wall synthesis protein Wag31 n=1 Tax=Herbiconiux flava TaxID=881268 RepID=A0A852SR94_9MICO|nr:DivIVA domain-containing protein [Herbiconiux flava]NYD71244.1 DivIVA domain-containing protein [Herbiconiux flava]GLK18792.1 cell division protein DivIVA [Herbiconiux flava]
MALTPEDVVNKRFSQTKFREGYDQDEVDDFLDEVVVELRRLTQENEELKAQLESGSAPVAAAPAAAEETPAPAPVAEVPAPVAAAPAAVPAPAPAAEVEDESVSTTNLLQLARRLHDEHVKEGADKRDALIAEGHATAARIVAEAETKQRNELARLNQEKAGIEHRIDELRTFEKDYRAGLKSYIEDQLKDLTSSSVDNEKTPSSSFSGFGG